MSRDDYHVVVYLILSYLYECLKNGVRPDEAQIKHDAPNIAIPYTYWAYIIRRLFQDGYVEGVVLVGVLGSADKGVKLKDDFNITPKGIAYLNENSGMSKAKEFVKTAASFLPWFVN